MTINPHNLDLSGTNLVLESLLHNGNASSTYKCTTNDSKKTPVCVKRKDIAEADKVLAKEVKLVQALKGITPAFRSSYKTKDSVLVVTELAGLSIQDHFFALKKKFSMQTIAMIGLRILGLLEQIHARGLIHGSLEPKKILTDRDPNNNSLYLVGLSCMKKFKNEKGEHIRYRERSQGEHFIVNNFSSGTKHLGRISRRDDVESLAYILLYLDTQGEVLDNFKGQDLQAWKASTPADKMHPKATSKQIISLVVLKLSKDELVKFAHYAKNLGFEERPDYDRIRSILKQLLSKNSPSEHLYDWSIKTEKIPSNIKVSQKRKALCGLLKFEKKTNFSTIFEEQFEEGDSSIASPQKYNTGDTRADLSPYMNKTCGKSQLPTFKTHFFREALSNDKTSLSDDSGSVCSPSNCSDIPDDMQPIFEKVKSLQTKAVLGIICGLDDRYC